MPRFSGNVFFQATCLKPTYSLRRQVLVSFGITGFLSIFIVVSLACFTAISAGDHVRTEARKFMRDQVIASIVNSSQYAAETFSEELDHLRGTASLIVEITRDRIAGYPRPGWEEDVFVPFYSREKVSRYPLKSPLLPRDWNLSFNVHATNAEEHLQETLYMMDEQQYHDHPHGDQERFVPHHAIMRISTSSALYFFQGNCDPEIQSPDNFKYYANCTSANNNGTTGGVIWPTSTNAALEKGAADIGTLLKPIWESRPDILFAGVFFANEGAGSMVHFPSFVHHNRDNGYVSIGCDWLHENTNKYTNSPFFSKATTSKCHPAGSWVNNREYNVLEQEWCRDQALHPNETRFFGPFVDETFTPGGLFKTHAFDLRLWVVRVGRAVFDRYTHEFIGCIAVDVLLNRFSDLMGAGPDKSRQLIAHDFSEAVLVKRTDGQVVAGGGWNGSLTNSTVHISETNLIPNRLAFEVLLEDLDHTERRHEQSLKDRQQLRRSEYASSVPTTIIELDGRVLSASSLPSTDFVFIQSVRNQVFDVIDEVKAKIENDVTSLVALSLMIGLTGVLILMVIVWTVALVLTQPLDWMRIVAWRIVNHTDSSVERDALKVYEDQGSGEYLGSGREKFSASILRWTPRSEITQLVSEFKNMIRGFSGRDYASTVATPLVKEVRNLFIWQSDFQQLYRPGKSAAGEEGNKAALQNSQSNLDCRDEEDLDRVSEKKNPTISEPSKGSLSVSSSGDRFLRRMSNEFGKGHFRRRSSIGDSSAGDILKERVSRDSMMSRESSRKHLANNPADELRDGENDDLANADVSSEAEELFRSSKMNSEHPKTAMRPKHSEAASVALSATAKTTSTQNYPVDGHEWQNKGRHAYLQRKALSSSYDHASEDHGPAISSMLFRWIMVLIVIPMLVTNVVVVVLVSSRLTSVLPEWLAIVGSAAFEIALDDLVVSAKLAALYAESTLAAPVRDLFLFTRLSGWLYTDAINRNTDAFTMLDTSTELCKHYEEDVYTCPWYDDIFENVPCDCKWEEPQATHCFRMGNDLDTRNLQKMFWSSPASDSDPDTGRRSRSSYPEVDESPEKTAWYKNASKLPGSWQEASASGYNTSYNRLRVFSALSVIVFPIYNYRPTLVAKGDHSFLGIYMGFEQEGMLSGWAGCRHPSSSYAFFRSSDRNLAYSFNASLCPEGKYGFDPRCRGWYTSGKSKATSRILRESSSLHIVAPYEFASLNTVASSATQAIIDPRTDEHIGQALIDFLQFEILNFGLQQDRNNFYVVITPSDEEGGGDTVVAPDHIPGTSENIASVLLKYDRQDSPQRLAFDDILKDMKAGSTKTVNFTRANEDGEAETIWLAYDPIYVRALEAMQNHDYARGVRVSQSLVYSLGVGRTLTALQEPFSVFEDNEDTVLQRKISLYIAFAVCLSLLILAVTYQISVAITKPMTTLLHIVQNINAGRIDHDIPPLFGGSREVNQVYTSFAKLFKIVRVSNTAFFSGNLEWACHFVRDALKLFLKVGDPKAVAIASNNLGNTLLAMSSNRPPEDCASCLEINNSCVIKEALKCYETAIQTATDEFASARDLHKKAEFAEQLADRHFNRALYFFISRNDLCSPEDAEELGYQDLRKAHALDQDVQGYMVKNKLLLQKSDILFNRFIRRVYGLIALQQSGIEQIIWDPNELVYDCHRLLTAAWDDFAAPLFHELDRFGRLQQLEGAMILLELHRANDIDAARLAMRMLVEDEYLNEFSFQSAAEAVLQFTTKDDTVCLSWTNLSKASAQRDISNILKSCKRSTPMTARKCFFLCIDLGNLQHIPPNSMHELSTRFLGLYDSSCGKDDFFGLLACNGNGSLATMEVECRPQKMGGHHQRSAIETAMLSLCSTPPQVRFSKGCPHRPCKVLMDAVDKVVESDAPSFYDSYIVFATDSPLKSWDPKIVRSVKQKIEEMNSKREGDIHVIIFNLILESAGMVEDKQESLCRNLCGVSQGSHYLEASLERLQNGFDEVASILSRRTEASATHNAALMAGITMEKF